MNARKVLCPVSVNLYDTSPERRERPTRIRRLRSIHRIAYNDGGRLRNPVALNERENALEVGGHEVDSFRLSPTYGKLGNDVGLNEICVLSRCGRAIRGANAYAEIIGRLVASREHDSGNSLAIGANLLREHASRTVRIAHTSSYSVGGNDLTHLAGDGQGEWTCVVANDDCRLGKSLPRKPAKGIGNPKRILMGIALVHAHAPGIPKEVNDAHERILRVWA